MSQIADSVTGEVVTGRDAGALEARIARAMTISVVLAVVIAAIVAPWRVTAGLLLGGALSIFNYRWLHSSVVAIVNLNARTSEGRAKSLRYLLRYFVVGAIVVAVYQLNLVSLAAALAGLCAFVPALFVEAFRQFYFVIINREESI
jgi:hypothetical protein